MANKRYSLSPVLALMLLPAADAVSQTPLGLPTHVANFAPVPPSQQVTMIRDLDTFHYGTVVVRDDGRVLLWGVTPEMGFDEYATQGVATVLDGASRLRGVDRVALGLMHLVAITESGSVQCVGWNGFGQCDAPSTLGAAVSVAAGEHTSLAIDPLGRLHLWGFTPAELPNGPADLGPVVQADCARAYAAALGTDGDVRVWGWKGTPKDPGAALPPMPDWPDDVTKIACAREALFGLASSGEVHSWTWDDPFHAQFVVTPTDAIDIDASDGFAVAVLESGWVIPSVAAGTFLQPPPPISPVLSDVHVGATFVLGVDAQGTLVNLNTGYGINHGAFAQPHGVTAVDDVIGTQSRGIVVLNADGTVASWARCLEAGCVVPEFTQAVVAISGSYTHEMALLADGSVVCWGENGAGECTVPADLGPVASIVAGDGLSLAIQADGVVRAWGRNEYGQRNVPAIEAPVVSMDTNGKSVVAVLADGTIATWGAYYSGQLEWFDSLENVVEVAWMPPLWGSAPDGYIARQADGRVTVWRWNLPPLEAVVPDAVQVGTWWTDAVHPVARLADGTIVYIPSGVPVDSLWRFEKLCRGGRVAIIADEDCADLDGDGMVGGAELAAVLGAWGTDGGPLGADFDGSGLVDGADLLIVLSQYGECGP